MSSIPSADAAWLAKATRAAPDLTAGQRRELVAIVEEEGGFTVRARQRIAFLTGDESWQPSVDEALATMAARERYQALRGIEEYAARIPGLSNE